MFIQILLLFALLCGLSLNDTKILTFYYKELAKMSMMRNFDKEFVERTRDLLASDIQGKALEYDVTLLLNCLLAMLTLPLERTRHKKDSNDLLFKTKCTNFLKNNAIITK